MKYWLMKSEPDECSIDDVLAAPGRKTPWSGVRNYQARNFMRDQMRIGDGVLFYHSSCAEPGIAGIAEVASAAYTDESQFDRKSPYLDAAILFSDILTIPDAMGLGLQFTEGEGPRFERPLRDEHAIAALAAPDPTAELGYVLDAVRQIRRALADRVPLIGFAGSPFTLACYMIEGSGSDDWRTVKTMRHARPDLLHRVLEVNTRAITAYLQAQIAAGIQVAMIFDT